MDDLFAVSAELAVQRKLQGASLIKTKPLGDYMWFTGYFTKGQKVVDVIAQGDPSVVSGCLKHCKSNAQGRF